MRNKSRLALLRLMHHEHLTDRDTQTLKTYIREHGKGCDSEAAWESIREDFQDDVDAWSSYMEISRPDKIGRAHV